MALVRLKSDYPKACIQNEQYFILSLLNDVTFGQYKIIFKVRSF